MRGSPHGSLTVFSQNGGFSAKTVVFSQNGGFSAKTVVFVQGKGAKGAFGAFCPEMTTLLGSLVPWVLTGPDTGPDTVFLTFLTILPILTDFDVLHHLGVY